MPRDLADLVCPTCHGYVHPFLGACPGCGTRRPSWYAAALSDPGTGSSLGEGEEFARAATETGTKHLMLAARGGGLGAIGGAVDMRQAGIGPRVEALADQVARAITYRAVGLPPDRAAAVDADLRVGPDGLQFRSPRGGVLFALDPALLLAATPAPRGTRALTAWTGIEGFDGRRELLTTTVDGDGLLLTFRDGTEFRQVTLGNRRGFLASKAREEHFLDLARWLGALGALATERRWQAVGAATYAAQLGLRQAQSETDRPAEDAVGGAS